MPNETGTKGSCDLSPKGQYLARAAEQDEGGAYRTRSQRFGRKRTRIKIMKMIRKRRIRTTLRMRNSVPLERKGNDMSRLHVFCCSCNSGV